MQNFSTIHRFECALVSTALTAAVLVGCGQSAPVKLSVSDMKAEPGIDKMGETALSISFDLTNEGDQDVTEDLLPRITLDGTQVPFFLEGTDKDDTFVLAPGESATLTATVVPSRDGVNEWKMVAAPDTDLKGADLIDVVAEAANDVTDVDAHIMDGTSWEECDPDTVHLTITGCIAQATTETSPARLMVRGTIENDTSLTTPVSKLPVLVMDGQEVELTLYAKGEPVNAIVGRTESEGSVADFEATLEFDPAKEHTFKFSARPKTVCEGVELASEISDYLATFDVA